MDVADMSGKTVVITGGNSGIGLETAVALARAGATTVITARDKARGEAAVADIRARAGNDRVDVVVFDLASLASVRQGAADILARCPRIDVLVNNAGLVLGERQETADGFEATFGTNHLGPFLLTELLLDRIKASAPARIVNVASTAHKGARGGLAFDDLQATRRYSAMNAYSKSKLANIYFTTELARRLDGTGVTVNWDTSGVFRFGLSVIQPFVLNAEKGARTSVYVASSPDIEGVTGKYFVKCQVRSPSRAARDDTAAAKLWKVSEEYVSSGAA
jgi:NAD(P)-dependent dehydrogenase (short-subunit alcohol dehydrogenase family)